MKTGRLCDVADKVFKILNDLNPNFMKKIFHRSPNLTYRKENHYVHFRSKIEFGNKVIWDTHIKITHLACDVVTMSHLGLMGRGPC